MAAPTKNFTDPTYVSWMWKSGVTPVAVGRLSDRGASMAALAPAAFTPVITMLGAMAADTKDEVKPKIPPPPMGRQIILTFPPIYKERGAGGFTTGQLFPPANPPRLT